jgi:hypothetical protein
MFMSNRREFLQMTLAASALPAFAAQENEPSSSLRIPQPGRVRVDDVIVESTSPMALAFGDEAARLGFAVSAVTDDVTDLWYHYLSARWEPGPAVVAGVTLSTSLFCLETLANDRGMRLWFRSDHVAMANGQTRYEMSGARQLVERAAAFGRDWGCEFASLLAQLPPWHPEKSQADVVDAAPDKVWNPAPLVSWIIAPRLVDQLPLV